MTKSLPLRLRDIFFPIVCVKAQPPNAEGKVADHYDDDDIVVTFAFELSSDKKGAHAVLKLETKITAEAAAPLPYELEMQVVAGFDVVLPEHEDEKALWFRKNAAAAALIGAAREQVAMTTARGPWGTAFMPMISIHGLIGAFPKGEAIAAPQIKVAAKPETKPAAKPKRITAPR